MYLLSSYSIVYNGENNGMVDNLIWKQLVLTLSK